MTRTHYLSKVLFFINASSAWFLRSIHELSTLKWWQFVVRTVGALRDRRLQLQQCLLSLSKHRSPAIPRVPSSTSESHFSPQTCPVWNWRWPGCWNILFGADLWWQSANTSSWTHPSHCKCNGHHLLSNMNCFTICHLPSSLPISSLKPFAVLQDSAYFVSLHTITLITMNHNVAGQNSFSLVVNWLFHAFILSYLWNSKSVYA